MAEKSEPKRLVAGAGLALAGLPFGGQAKTTKPAKFTGFDEWQKYYKSLKEPAKIKAEMNKNREAFQKDQSQDKQGDLFEKLNSDFPLKDITILGSEKEEDWRAYFDSFTGREGYMIGEGEGQKENPKEIGNKIIAQYTKAKENPTQQALIQKIIYSTPKYKEYIDATGDTTTSPPPAEGNGSPNAAAPAAPAAAPAAAAAEGVASAKKGSEGGEAAAPAGTTVSPTKAGTGTVTVTEIEGSSDVSALIQQAEEMQRRDHEFLEKQFQKLADSISREPLAQLLTASDTVGSGQALPVALPAAAAPAPATGGKVRRSMYGGGSKTRRLKRTGSRKTRTRSK